MFHAALANDAGLCGSILQERGGLALLIADGTEPFLQASRHLTSQVEKDFPRLAPMLCVALLMAPRREEADAVYESYLRWYAAAESGRSTPEDPVMHAECVLLQSLVEVISGRSVENDRLNGLLSEAMRLAEADWLLPGFRGAMHAVLAYHTCERARFQLSRRRGAIARDFFRIADSSLGCGVVDLVDGVSAMAQGRVREAAALYSGSQLATFAKPLSLELRIERSGKEPGNRWCEEVTETPHEIPGWFDVRVAAQNNRAEALFEREGPEAAADFLEQSIDQAARAKLVREQRLLCAQRVSWLVAAGRTDAARRAWDDASFPETLARLLDLARQSWREFEGIGCARVALLGALGQFDDARLLARSLASTAKGWELRRTLMRCLAAWAIVEHRASNPTGALARLQEYLRAYRDTDYARPLAREGEAGVRLLRSLFDGESEPETRQLARQLLQKLDGPGQTNAESSESTAALTEMHGKILQYLAQGRRNKEIARSLGLTESGVRYHLKRIYRSLGTNNRIDAVRRARERGVVAKPAIPDEAAR